MSKHNIRRLRIAIIGFGRLGRACAAGIHEWADLELAGIVRREESAREPLPEPFRDVRCVSHVSELERIDAALVCVPTDCASGVAGLLLQSGVPLVECASLEGDRFRAHRDEIDRLATHHRVPAVVGAGWVPGVARQVQRLFEILIPKGQTTVINRPGVSLHHSAAAEGMNGVKGALCSELRTAEGKLQRYLYLELNPGAELEQVKRAVESDPLFLGEETYVFELESIAALEEEGHGILIERRGMAGAGLHDTVLLEARFSTASFAAHIMLDAARLLPQCRPGAHVYSLRA
ncbi:MAG: Gfo/Idh/MocA family oxidoreductase [Thiobacillaceae bacterium]